MIKKNGEKIQETKEYVLRLYITGSTPQSTRALVNLKNICEKYLPGSYDLEVIDIYQNPNMAREQQIIAAPTLVKMSPLPFRRLIGDMSDEARVLLGLGVELKIKHKALPKNKAKKKAKVKNGVQAKVKDKANFKKKSKVR